MIAVIDIFLMVLGIYMAMGVAFGIYFVLVGAVKLDDGVKGTPWHFRLLLFPGSVLLWSVLLTKLLKSRD